MTTKYYHPDEACSRAPTRQCTICNRVENIYADYISTEFWICPECLTKLRRLLANSNTDLVHSEVKGIMTHHD